MADPLTSLPLPAPPFSSAAMCAVLDGPARLRRMLDFTAALARAEAAVGLIPAGVAGEIADACRIERIDTAVLAQSVAASSDGIGALVTAIGAEAAKRNPRAASYVLWGAVPRDLYDTVLVLELRAAIEALDADLDRAIAGFVGLAGKHRRSMALARTTGAHSGPAPFGLRLAGYAAALGRARERLRHARKDILTLQLGGPTATLPAFGDQALAVVERVAAMLDLPTADAPWHGHRDRLAEVASAFAILAGTCGKIARDAARALQPEIAEIAPTTSGDTPPAWDADALERAEAAAATAPQLAATILLRQIQDHDGGAVADEAERTAFTALAHATAGALATVAAIAQTVQANVDRLAANLDRSASAMAGPLRRALAGKIDDAEAAALVGELVRKAEQERKPLREVAEKDARLRMHLDGPELTRLFFPAGQVGAAQVFIDRQVASAQGRGIRRPVPQPAPPPPDNKDSLAAKLRSVTSAATELGSLAKPEAPTPPAAQPTEPTPSPSPSPSQADPESGALLDIFAKANSAIEPAPAANPSSDKST